MYKTMFFSPMALNLQLFADGGAGDGGTGTDAGAMGVTGGAAIPQSKGVKNPLADVKYGIQEDAQTANVQTEEAESVVAPDREKEFEKLIKGEYKDLFDARMQDTVQKRLKSTKDTVEKYNALSPTLELLAKKYGVDATDIDALNRAIEEDDSYFEEEALEKGVSVEHLKEIRKLERDNADLRKQMREQSMREQADQLYSQWLKQADDAKLVYPSLDLATEIQNPDFTKLIQNGIDVRTAYEVVHKDQIIQGAMQFTAKKVESKLAKKMTANGARPMENGTSAQSASLTKSDVSQLTKADRDEIDRRVARGEKIRF